jgi:uncharacterized protein (TIGR00255 family)
MSLKSMTGYGRGEGRAAGFRAVVEISAVNRRQLDLQMTLPRALQALEPRMREDIGSRISRGRVTVAAQILSAAGPGGRRVRVDEALAREWAEALRGAARRLKLRDDVSVSLLLQAPDVVIVEHPEEDVERVWPVLREALRRALRALGRMRAAEGRALAADLSARLARMAEMVEAIAARAPVAAEHHRRALLERVRRAGVGADEREASVAREIALFADRSDISEELTRLRSHLAQGRHLMRTREPAGRALDFLAQELLREINTVGSKCCDAAIAAETVRFKTELERFREQVQNVE